MYGCIIEPLFAIAEVTIAIKRGEVRVLPCPIAVAANSFTSELDLRAKLAFLYSNGKFKSVLKPKSVAVLISWSFPISSATVAK